MRQACSTPIPRPSRKAALALAILGLAAPLAACGVDRTVTPSLVEDDLRARHPIILTHAPSTLDIFPPGNARGLDRISADQLRQFAADYRQNGEGQISVMLPQGGEHGDIARGALDSIRRELVAGGARGYIKVGTYPVADPSLASPVRLSFTQLKAKVANACGQWPADLASGGTLESWNNRPFYNLGCSYQNALAAQVDNPRDLVGPRAEKPSDTTMRTRAIGNVRKGLDPGTEWKTKNSEINVVGG